ncbi:hypothetical protein PpBr36_07374 [Pyricularia pennisetigena]|uniref:hypothetical protein n=1 Tax=Pyricularia pennisetigena TaxID=1578925 RepID=UPI00114FDA6F
MKHHVPNEVVAVEASRLAWPREIRIACMRCAGSRLGVQKQCSVKGGPQFIPHEFDLTHSPRMGIVHLKFITGTLLYLQYSPFCIACISHRIVSAFDGGSGIQGRAACLDMTHTA